MTCAGDELSRACRGAGQHDSLHAAGLAQQVFDGEPTAPRVSVQVEPAQVERAPDRPDFGDEPVDCPQRWIVGLVRAATAELVVEDDRPVGGEVAEWFEIVVPGARSAVQYQQRRTPPTTDDVDPDATAGDLDVPLAGPEIERGAEGGRDGGGQREYAADRQAGGRFEHGASVIHDHRPFRVKICLAQPPAGAPARHQGNPSARCVNPLDRRGFASIAVSPYGDHSVH